MQLVRYGRAGVEKPGLIDSDGKLRDLARVVKDITPEVLSPAGLKRLRSVNVERLPVVGGRPRLGPPLTGIGKMVCIGLNYSDHAREVGRPAPDEPTLFIKANSSINGPGYWNFDSSIFKRLTFTERIGGELRADVFNILNHPNPGNPATGVTGTTFGQITGMASTARLVRFGVRVTF